MAGVIALRTRFCLSAEFPGSFLCAVCWNCTSQKSPSLTCIRGTSAGVAVAGGAGLIPHLFMGSMWLI